MQDKGLCPGSLHRGGWSFLRPSVCETWLRESSSRFRVWGTSFDETGFPDLSRAGFAVSWNDAETTGGSWGSPQLSTLASK